MKIFIGKIKLIKVVLTVTLLSLLISGVVSWQLSLSPEKRIIFKGDKVVDTESSPALDPREAKARKIYEETLTQQATMASSVADTIVPEGCDELPWRDPLNGVLRFRSSDLGKTKNGDYWYLGRLIDYSEQKRGECTDSVLVFEYLVGTEPRKLELRLPKQMLGKGSLGVVLPKVVGYKRGLRVELVVNYEVNENKSLRVKSWSVENLFVD